MPHALVEKVQGWHGLLIRGHSLSGGVAQVAALRARQFSAPSGAGTTHLVALQPIFSQLGADGAQKQGVLALLVGTRCSTFEAPAPFAPKSESSEAQLRRAHG